LSGTGADPAHLVISPTSNNYGNTEITSPPSGTNRAFLVQNDGGVPTGLISTSLTGTNTNQFDKAADSCDPPNPANHMPLQPGAACTIDVIFEPTSLGSKSANLDLSATPGGTLSVPLTGQGGTPPNLTISPTPTYNFGNVLQGTDSQTQRFTVTNTGQQ